MGKTVRLTRKHHTTTAGNTATPVGSVVMDADGSMSFAWQLNITHTTNQKTVTAYVQGGVKRASGTITDLGGTLIALNPADGGAAQTFQPTGPTFTISGNVITFKVTGLAATAITWGGTIEILKTTV